MTDKSISSEQQPTASAFTLKTAAAALSIALIAFTLAFLPTIRASLPKLIPQKATTNSIRAMSTTSPSLKITKRPWSARGHADHGWLYTFHTFSFASYYSPKFESYGPLRVINEDRVERGTGFGTHSHAEFLIWSYIVSGELEHKDSMGNLEKLRRGEVQFTSAGTGIRHSEYNRNNEEDVHFLQIWAKPNVKGLKPSYVTRKFTDDMKKDKLVRVLESVDRHDGADTESSPIPANADVSQDASILSPGKSVEHTVVGKGKRNVYLHVVMTGKKQPQTGGAQLKVGETVLGEGDGAFVDGSKGGDVINIESVGDKDAEFLLFDMGAEEV
ncbi:RmlC-like cupin [Aulographum hederae CBS 113979]|uniref:RmlC-like cupin n=1 Tax=Aulographum hederae CBS 113979 TaxID=1176131 RepID=A0A6G1HGT0_9PEZI|nr:RmlC-like cupin [Aulographum hederae CBS 113979]